MGDRDAYRRQLSNFFISQLLLNAAVWQVPQLTRPSLLSAPINPFSDLPYRGINALRLLAAQQTRKLDDPRWVLDKDVEENGLALGVGPLSLPVLYRKDGEWDVATAYHAGSIGGLGEQQRRAPTAKALLYTREIAADMGVQLVQGDKHGFRYSVAEDVLHVPALGDERQAGQHYGAMIYHLMHADGHETRNGRELGAGDWTNKTDRQAVDEALHAHLAALFVSSRLHVPFVPDPAENHGRVWIEQIGQDLQYLSRVAGLADKTATQFIERAIRVTHEQELRKAYDKSKAPLPRGQAIPPQDRRYLFVPYEDNQLAKDADAFWDPAKKMRFVHLLTDTKPFQKWLEPAKPLSMEDVKQQFRNACIDFQLDMSHEKAVIEMDGQWRGVPVTSRGKSKKLSGRYRLDADGHGQILNMDNGVGGPFRPNGRMASDEKTQEQLREAQLNQERLRAAELREQEKVEAACARRWAILPDTDHHPYTDRKEVPAIGLKLWGENLAIPMRDATGAVRNIQRISPVPGGPKLYEKGARKSGLFHVLGELDGASVVLFGEGYATCATPHVATGFPTVVCFDSSNIQDVMHALRDRLPKDVDKIILADNDMVTHERLARTLNGGMREKLGYPEIRADDVGTALASKDFFMLGDSGFALTVREQVDESHYEMLRLHAEVFDGDKRVHRVMINNAGMEKALAAAQAEGAKVVAPSFKDPDAYSKKHKDYNDLGVTEGLDAVREQLASVVDLVKGRAFAEERARELKYNLIKVHPAENDARHTGEIVLHAGCHAVQEVGKQKAVAHSYRDLDQIPTQGKVARIEYRDGRGKVSEIVPPERSKGRG